jgi:hypothetical protein
MATLSSKNILILLFFQKSKNNRTMINKYNITKRNLPTLGIEKINFSLSSYFFICMFFSLQLLN